MNIERDIFISVETTDEESAIRFVGIQGAVVEEDLEAKPSKPGLKVFNVYRDQPKKEGE